MKIAVLGVGSAGSISIAQLCAHIPKGWTVTSIHDPSIPMFQIGESTNANMVSVLEQACHFSFTEDLPEMESTIKFGNKFMKWREHDWFNPLLDGGIGIHFNNFKLKEFVIGRVKKYWADKFRMIEGNISDVVNHGTYADVIVDGQTHTFDWVIDTRGTPTNWDEYEIVDGISINSGIIHTVHEPGNFQYTEHLATANGWMFGVPLTSRHTHGYLYNDKITSKEEAIEDMRRYFNTDDIGRKNAPVHYHFKSYFAKKVLEGRVLKNGNRANFFEPISASGIFYYIFTNYLLIDLFKGKNTEDDVNQKFRDFGNQLADLICFFYHGGSTYDTPFWRYAKENARKRLFNSQFFRRALIDCYVKGQSGLPHYADPWIFSGYHLHLIDEKFGYNYFTDPIKNQQAVAEIDANLNSIKRTEI